jgi:hypothetical protein
VNLHPEISTPQHYYYKIALNPNGTGKLYTDIEAANSTFQRLKRLDSYVRMFDGLLHGYSILGVVGFFPQIVNSWREKK